MNGVMVAWFSLMFGLTGVGALFAVVAKFLARAGGGFR